MNWLAGKSCGVDRDDVDRHESGVTWVRFFLLLLDFHVGKVLVVDMGYSNIGSPLRDVMSKTLKYV